MSARLTAGVGIAVSVALWLAPIGASHQAPFRARTDAVSLTVSVMRGKAPVTGLGAADFTLTDNGVPQTVEVVSLEQVPIDNGGLFAGQDLVLEGYFSNVEAIAQ